MNQRIIFCLQQTLWIEALLLIDVCSEIVNQRQLHVTVRLGYQSCDRQTERQIQTKHGPKVRLESAKKRQDCLHFWMVGVVPWNVVNSSFSILLLGCGFFGVLFLLLLFFRILAA